MKGSVKSGKLGKRESVPAGTGSASKVSTNSGMKSTKAGSISVRSGGPYSISPGSGLKTRKG